MFKQLYQSTMSSIRAKLLLVMMVVALVPLLGIMVYGLFIARDMIEDFALREQQHHVHTLALGLESFLEDIRDDVLFFSRSVDVRALLQVEDAEEYEAARRSLEQQFLVFSQIRGIYYQMRFIDAQGMEVVRVDSDGTQAFIVPRDQLQDKSGRYYFEDSIQLPPGEIMVSPLDLNVEHGEIERPFNPVIRYATPVWFEGQPAGIVIVNVFAAQFLDPLGEQTLSEETIFLVDQQGYYLYHSADEAKRWGRDLGTGFTLERDYPGLLAEVFSGEHKHLDNQHASRRVGEVLFTFTSLAPSETIQWGLISYRPLSVVLAPVTRLQGAMLIGLVLVLLFVVGLGRWSSGWLVRPIRKLESMAEALGEGDLQTPIVLESAARYEASDEIVLLAATLDQARQGILEARQTLEQQVTAAERRAVELRTAAQVAAAATAILDPQELLNNVVTLISERFGFYHTGAFLLDETGTWAVLTAASSRGGQRMLAREHRLQVGEQGIVGYVAATGKPRIALDVGADAVHFVNPDLPDTRSEMALPLQIQERILGVLDVQSVEPEAFSDEDLATLQILADQIAMAMGNARLFQQAQANLDALQRARGEYTFQAWTELARALEGGGYRYHRKTLVPAEDFWRSEMTMAVQQGQVVQNPAQPDVVAIPLRDRDQIIGVMDARKPEEAGVWTEDEIALLEMLGHQLEIALGSARAYQETRLRQTREQTVRQITDSMRRSLEVEVVAQRAAQELSQALKAATVTVRLGTKDTLLLEQSEEKV